ncbi:MAG: hypothetical protein GY852_04255, partial [bacterium]|nr:hypothetical protein [bacterium]
NNPNSHWIANPFGIRPPGFSVCVAKDQFKENDTHPTPLHRDVSPCPVGGCVTPEMQRDFQWEFRKQGKSSPALECSSACPFYFRHTNESLSQAIPNPLRFAQCYVLLPAFREFMQKSGIVVSAPVHRSPEGINEPGETFWYPLYSGYAFIQLPTQGPIDDGVLDESLSARWILTRMAREQRYRSIRRLPIHAVFQGAELGVLTTEWERKNRIVSISEGQATV